MNGSYGNTSFVVRLRGLPWNTTQTEVQNFLQGCNVRQTNFVTNDQGRATGECFVVLESNEDVDNAKSFHQKNIGSRYIEVFESNADEMTQTTKNNTTATTNNNNNNNNNNNANSNLNTTNQNSENNSSNTDNWREPVIRLRGLPYNSSKEDVTRFFDGTTRHSSEWCTHLLEQTSRRGFRRFCEHGQCPTSFGIQPHEYGASVRYIEVFKSTYAEARASIMNDTQSMARQRGSGPNQNYGNQRQGNYGGYSGNMGGNSGFNNNMNQFDGPPQDNYNFSGADDAGNNFPMNNQMGSGTGVKRPMTVSFTMKIRGVPFEAGEKEVFEFFSPVVPIRLEQENTPRGKPPIWYAEFGSREEATEALTYHKKYMGTRYIELLPLYDDVNRSKMMATPTPEELDRQLDEFIDKLVEDKDQLPKGELDDAFWKDLEGHPFFLKEMPDDGAELHPATAALQALQWDDDEDTPLDKAKKFKDEGNKYYGYKKYRNAILAYTEGIKQRCSDPTINAVLFCNRATANFYLGNYRSALHDCVFSRKCKSDHLKAFIKGAESCMKLEKYKDAQTWCSGGLSVSFLIIIYFFDLI
ncbi:unnamed protein product [Rotaria magnacalcarata]|uniref:RRM domain-containing protein n=3 Tax=Rotaria magnacalcarata TaxID=392030 RepID=A0A8S2L4U6_9BILA|nr:unnamed protein product [Rotaria magnacalcarata]CAF3881000.1 unnamed protein product [Rotaria magnacalcarata]